MKFIKIVISFICYGALCNTASAALLPCDKVDDGGNINAPGGCIARSLEDQISTGRGNKFTEGSSIYLIKRDPARSVRRGRQLFQRKFSVAEGIGPRVNSTSTGDVTHSRALGAGAADSCALCHGRPRGSAGFGGDVSTRPDSRDAPHLFGLGLIEQLGDEMTKQLRRKRITALGLAQAQGSCVNQNMNAKGVNFGVLIACPDGTVDTSGIVGVDANLRVKPFFHQGGTASIREFVIGALKDEMGLQAFDPVLCAATDPSFPQTKTSPSGFKYDPSLDVFERPAVCNPSHDPDGDGVVNEIDPALVDHFEFYLLNYFKPGQYKVTNRTQQGLEEIRNAGCTSCHMESMVVNRDRRVADVETNYDATKGIFNGLFAVASTLFKTVDDGETYPMLLPEKKPFVVHNLFSDLKRHDLGPAFHEREYDGTMVTQFVTEPLWGVGSTAPYGHDGRSINLDSVIMRHGGEAQASRNVYAGLEENKKRMVLEFLESLVLFPPDDTASNLNPGNPGNPGDIQSPATHGSINLGALFQIASEGVE